MSDSHAIDRPAVRRDRLDLGLNVALSILLVGILALGGVFGWQVYVDRQRQNEANASYRVIRALEDQIRQAPNDVILRVRLGEALASAGKYPAAIEQLNLALKLDPKHPGAYLDLGMIAIRTENYSEAIEYFNKVIEITDKVQYTNIDERRETAYYSLGMIALYEERYEDAAGYFNEALRIRKDASDTYYHLGKALEGLGDIDGAIENVEIAILFDPNYAAARYFLGQLFMEKDDPVNASIHFRAAADLAPEAEPPQEALASLGTAEEWARRAKAAQGTGDLKAAVDPILVATNLEPENVGYQLQYAEILLGLDQPKPALKTYQKVLELEPENKVAKQKAAELEKQLATKK